MNRILPLILLIAVFFSQCKKKDDPVPQTGPMKEIDVIDISIDGVDSNDVFVGNDIIVIHLPENFAGGDFIKPHILFGTGYSTRSELVNGFSFEGKELDLALESTYRQPRTFKIFVIPHKAISLTEAPRDHQVTLGPEARIPVPIKLRGTMFTANDSGKIVHDPVVVLKSQSTGAVAHWLYPSKNGQDLSLSFPATVASGTYTAEVVWGAQTEVLSRNLTIRQGPLQLRRDRWYMVAPTRYFEQTGFNISKESKYELTVSNDFTPPQKISLNFKNAGTLTGNLPAGMGAGNYKVTYWKDGRIVEPYDGKIGPEKYMGDDQLYIKRETDQPLLRIISQPSHKKSYDTGLGFPLTYYASFVNISRNEPLIAYRDYSGPFPNRNDLVLINSQSRKEYAIPYSGDAYPIFDGFMVFLGYHIPDDVPAGKYEAYMITGTAKTEKYGELINIPEK